MTDALTTDFDDMRADARASGTPADVLMMRPAPGAWCAGVVIGWDSREAPFGSVPVLHLVGIRTSEGEHDPAQVKRLDLDGAVLRGELAADCDEPPAVGSLVYVEYLGERTSGKGARYRAYTVKKRQPTEASRAAIARARITVAVQAEPPRVPGGAAGAPDDDIPFSASAV